MKTRHVVAMIVLVSTFVLLLPGENRAEIPPTRQLISESSL
jgi:hypothetical protein